ncbi:MAG: threonine/serine exporter family protein, partial [Oscillospiraceae bacterium]
MVSVVLSGPGHRRWAPLQRSAADRGSLWPAQAPPSVSWPAWVQAIAVFVGCCGFCILFNTHGRGMVLCMMGGAASWMLYLLCRALGCDVYTANLFAALLAAVYAETMARVRRCPAMPYLVIAILPMLPGAGVYYTMSLGLEGKPWRPWPRGWRLWALPGLWQWASCWYPRCSDS